MPNHYSRNHSVHLVIPYGLSHVDTAHRVPTVEPHMVDYPIGDYCTPTMGQTCPDAPDKYQMGPIYSCWVGKMEGHVLSSVKLDGHRGHRHSSCNCRYKLASSLKIILFPSRPPACIDDREVERVFKDCFSHHRIEN